MSPAAPPPVSPPPASAGWVDERSASALRQRLDSWVARGHVAGLQYLVMRAGQAPFEHCAGMADAADLRPVVSQTQFNLYSITKPFTATLVAGLVLQGAVRLDEPIAGAAGLPALAGFGTLRETLLHRAGFANPWPLRWTHRAVDDAHFDEAAFVQQRLADAARCGPVSPRYSNLGYLALGQVVARASGLGLREAMHRQLIDRLGLVRGEALGFAPAPGSAWSAGHLKRYGWLDLVLGGLVRRREVVAGPAGRWVRLHHHHVNGSAYGGLIGNARALARFGMALLGHGTGVDDRLRQLVCGLQPGPAELRTLAWLGGQLAGQPWLGHAGGGLGAYGELRLYPGLATVSVLLTNRPGLRDARMLDRLDAAWLRPAGRP